MSLNPTLRAISLAGTGRSIEMNAFLVRMEHRPGEMARVCAVLARNGVNVLITAIGCDGHGIAGFVTGDEAAARSAFAEESIEHVETAVIHVRMDDTPGQAATIAGRLAEAGVNIDFWMPVDTRPDSFTVAVGVDNLEAAAHVLVDQLVDRSFG
jgi:hypothetical protein